MNKGASDVNIVLKVQHYCNYTDNDKDGGNVSNIVKIDDNTNDSDEIDYFSTCFVSYNTMDIINGYKNADCKKRLLCRLNTDNMKHSVIVWIQSISTIENNSVLASPKVIQKLHLPYNRDSNIILTAFNNDSNNRLIVREVNLCKISRYDNHDDSNDDDGDVKALQRYFSIKRLLQQGDIICVGKLPIDSIHHVAPTIAADLRLRFYYVNNILTAPSKNETNSKTQHEDTGSVYETLGQDTKVTLFSRLVNHRLPNIFECFKVTAYEISSHVNFRKNNRRSNLHDYVNSVRSISIPSSNSFEAPKDLMVVTDNVYRCNYHNHTKHLVMSVIEALTPLIDNRIFDYNARMSLLSSPLLLLSSSLEADIFNIVADSGGVLGLQVHTLNSRFLMNYKSGRANTFDNLLCSKVSDPSGISSIAPSLSISSILSCSPAILYIEGLDSHVASISKRDADMLETLSSNLSSFLSDLYESIRTSISNNTDHVGFEHSAILVVSSTGNLNALSTSLRMLFSTEINLDKIDKSFRDKEPRLDRSVSSSISITKSSHLKLWKEAEQRGGIAALVYERYLRESKLTCLKRHKSKIWFQNSGFTDIKIGPSDDGISILLTEQDIAQSFKSLELGTKKIVSSNGKIAPVQWEDIGGLDNVRKEIMNTLAPSANKYNDPSRQKRGLLLFGPPGTGKTLVAKAVATECGMAFISVKGPELLDVYVGESEKNVRDLFANARELSPCVMFFDELDSLAPARGRGNDAGGVMDRVVAQLLTEIDTLSLSDCGQVFIIGATNRPDLLDKALLRPGRFDTKIFLNVCKEISSRVSILKAQMRKFSIDNSVNLHQIAELLPSSVTGADIGALTSSAYFKALHRKLNDIKKSAVNLGIISDVSINQYLDSLSDDEIAITINYDDLHSALISIQPSVTAAEVRHYENLATRFSDD